jgi:hypothetical protein
VLPAEPQHDPDLIKGGLASQRCEYHDHRQDEIGNDEGRTNQAFVMLALRSRHFQAIGR